jgi:hypothetical protein
MLWAGFLSVRGLLAKVPVVFWIALACIAFWYWERDSYGAALYEEGKAEIQDKWDAETASEEIERIKEETRLTIAAKETDKNVEKARADNRDRTERFIDSGGVRPTCPRRERSEDNSSRVGTPLRETPELDGEEPVSVVTVLPDDVRICTDNTLLAEEFRTFILKAENKPQ